MPTPDNQAAAKKFSELGLSKIILAALNAAGYERPTDIQAGVIPLALAGKDVIGQARTGTGKTASFILPILNGYDATVDHRLPQAIVLVPTRELAVQVRDEAVKLSHGQNARIEAVYGGKPLKAQIDKLKRGCDVLIGTPGRVLDHLGRGSLRLDRLKFVVLDEADRMLDIGFRPDIEKILRKCPQSRQTLLLSATVPPEIMKLAQRYMMEPVTLDFSPKDLSVETIEQHYFTVDQHKKFELLLRLLVRERPRQAIVFCRTKRRTDTIHERLSKKLPRVEAIHGDLSQGQRDRVMRGFRDSRIRFLVATDVVGRGIDVSTVSHIINYDVPMFCDDYVHRVGRTGRMGREGVAYTFVTPEEGGELTRIEHRINRLLKRDEMKNFEAVESKAGGVNAAAAMLANRVGAKVDGEMSMDAAPLPASPPPKKAQKRYKRGL